MSWQDKLKEIRKDLPSKTPWTAERKRLTRKEVINQEFMEITRISDKIVRKRPKKINF